MSTDKHYEFWMVYGLGYGAPTMRHGSRLSAEREAERLARANHGIKFFILESIGGRVVAENPVTIIEMAPEEIPF